MDLFKKEKERLDSLDSSSKRIVQQTRNQCYVCKHFISGQYNAAIQERKNGRGQKERLSLQRDLSFIFFPSGWVYLLDFILYSAGETGLKGKKKKNNNNLSSNLCFL